MIYDKENESNILRPIQENNLRPAYMITEACNGCATCIDVCPNQCIDARRTPSYIRQELCSHCGSCADVCIKNAIVRVAKRV